MKRLRRIKLGQGLPLLRELQEEAATKRKQVETLQKTLLDLQAQLAELKGENGNGNGNGVGEIPWYKRYWKWLAVGGVGTVIAGIAIVAKKNK